MTLLSLPLLYQQYKEDTHAIVQWLEFSAKVNIFQTASNGANKRYTVATSDLEPRAEFIASKPQISVLSYFAATLDHAIGGRTLFGEQVKKTGVKCHCPTADKTHKHFINILQGVSDILQPARKHHRHWSRL